MDLNAYLFDDVVNATAPPNETAPAARVRTAAILEMVRAYDPTDAMQAMIACHCVMLQFLLIAAMRDANTILQEPPAQAKSRAGAISISRTLHQWATKLEKLKQRAETRDAAVGDPADKPAPQPQPQKPATPPASQPVSSTDRAAAPAQNGTAIPVANDTPQDQKTPAIVAEGQRKTA